VSAVIRTHAHGRTDLPRPLVMRCGALGDMVLLTVLLSALHARFGTKVDLICTGPWVHELLAGQASLGEVFVLGSRHIPYWASPRQRRLVQWLRARGAGPTWFCDRDAGRELLRRGGIPDDYVCDSRLFPWVPGETFGDRYLRLARFTPPGLAGRLPQDMPAVEPAAHLEIAPAARVRLEAWLAARGLAGRPYIIFHPGCRHLTRRRMRSRAGIAKYWPEERWAQVVRAVRERAPGHAIVFTGTRPEARLNADIITRAGVADLHNVAGELPLPQLLALLARAQSMIAVDTGPTHAAAALRRPTVALMGTIEPALYRPGGSGTPAAALTGRVDGRQDILGITPGDVVEAWSALARAPSLAQD
jgi:heptosyltransferase-2/heptosyltransferase-3